MLINGHENYNITFEEGAEMTRRFREQMQPGQRKGGFIGKDSMLELLVQDGCMGFRYYYGLDANGNSEVVFVGVDNNGNDMIGEGKMCVDSALPCPTFCGNTTILNT